MADITMEEVLELLKARDAALIEKLSAENEEALPKTLGEMTAEEFTELANALLHPSVEEVEELEEEPVEPAVEETNKELSNMDVNEIAAVNAIADIAASQDCYDTDAVRKLQMEVISEDEDRKAFAEKLATIQIQPDPIAPGDSSQDSYSVKNALSLTVTDSADFGLEKAVSDEIKLKSNLAVGGRDTVAIPRSALTQLATSTAANSAGSAIDDLNVGVIRSDIADPLDALQYFNKLASGPGDPFLVKWSVPAPAGVAEPADAGYAKTGDSTAAKVELTPHLVVGSYIITRLAEQNIGDALAQVLMFALQKMRETQNEHALSGAATNDVTGIYNTTSVGSTTVTAAAGYTVPIVRGAINGTFGFAKSDVKLFVHPDVRSHLQTLAQPAAVTSLMVNDHIDGVEVIQTKALSVADTKKFRGLVVPTKDVYYKEWDDAIFVTRRYESGVYKLDVEVFWDMVVGHTEAHYRIHQA